MEGIFYYARRFPREAELLMVFCNLNLTGTLIAYNICLAYIVIREQWMHTSVRSVSLLSFANEEDDSTAFSRKNLEKKNKFKFFLSY